MDDDTHGRRERVRLPVEGMHCAACVAAVERAVGRVEGVETASVNLLSREAFVTYDPSATGPALLREAIRKAGYEVAAREAGSAGDEAGRARREERRGLALRLAVAAPLAAAVHLLSMAPMLGLRLPLDARLAGALMALLALPVYLWAGWRFHRGALRRLARGAFDMDSLVSMGTSAAFFASLAMIARPGLAAGGHAHGAGDLPFMFDSAATIIAIVLLGRYIEARATEKAGAALRALASLRPATARIEAGGAARTIPIGEAGPGDVAVVHPGEAVPLDGTIVEGETTIDESAVSGESLPALRAPGDPVIGGTINLTGVVRVRVTRTGERAFLARVMKAVEEAQAAKPPVQKLADRIAAVFVPAVLAVAAATFAAWALAPGGGARLALEAAVSVLVIACPCALGLATPVAVAVAAGRAARAGIFIRGPAGFEALGRADSVALDKTGTVTRGRPEVAAVVPAEGFDAARVLRIAASVEAGSRHPLAGAIGRALAREGLAPDPVEAPEAKAGRGAAGIVGGSRACAGSERFLREEGVDVAPLAPRARELEERGMSVVYVSSGGAAAGLVAAADPVREESRATVAALGAMGMRAVLLTGDAEAPARRAAAEAGIGEVRARLLPGEKRDEVRRLQAQGHRVAMVGDGINDAPALAAADASVAMGTGSDVAVETADVGLMGRSLAPLVDAVRLSRRTAATIRQNFFWAFAYNVVAIPVAAGALYPLTGDLPGPMLAAAAMSLSSISVVVSSLRLLK